VDRRAEAAAVRAMAAQHRVRARHQPMRFPARPELIHVERPRPDHSISGNDESRKGSGARLRFRGDRLFKASRKSRQ
jgi:hypothetical protein